MNKKTLIKSRMKSFLVLLSGVFILTGCTSKVPLKDDSYVVYESNFGQVSAKEYYNILKEQQQYSVYAKFEKDILNSFKKSEDIKQAAESRVTAITTNISDSDKEGMDSELKSMGYNGFDEIQTFFENMIYRDRMAEQYVNDNLEELYPSYEAEYNPRIVSHILIKVEDTENVTAEEQKNLDEIKNRIVNGESFAEVAKEVSVDGSKDNGGSLGLMDKTTSFVPTFLEAALEQEAGKIYDWVKSDYGFHLILVDSTNSEAIKKADGLAIQMVTAVPQISLTVMNKLINDSGIEFLDADFEAKIREIMEGVK